MTVLKMLTSTRKRVMRRAIRPGMTSGGTTKLIQETTTNKPVQVVQVEVQVEEQVGTFCYFT